MQIFNHQFILAKKTSQDILDITLPLTSDQITIDVRELKNEEILIKNLPSDYDDGIIAIISNSTNNFYVHIKSGVLYCTPYLNNESLGSVDLNIEVYTERFIIKKEKYSYSVVDTILSKKYLLDEYLFNIETKPLPISKNRNNDEPYIYLKISYFNYVSFLEYTLKREEYSIKTNKYELYNNRSELEIDFKSANQFSIIGKDNYKKVKINKLIKNKKQIINEDVKTSMILPSMLMINNRLFIIDKDDKDSLLIYYEKRAELLFNETIFSAKNKKKGFLIEGKINYKFNIPVDTLITKEGEYLGEINWKENGEFDILIEEKSLKNLINIHNSLWFGIGNKKVHSMYRHNENESSVIVEDSFINGDRAYIIRLNKSSSYTLSIVPALPLYNNFNKIKINIAEFISERFSKRFDNKKVNLYFEKEASRASESGKTVFEKVINSFNSNSINKFILDKESQDYNEMKRKYKRHIIKRFTFKHYLYMFYANTYISSELSNHVIATRVFSDKINALILKTPLYFLQHGIMFAKPVDNPMAMGFHKENVSYNLKKSVISSDLEAKEFYKMGYSNQDLMKTGLPKLDDAKINPTANKITYMPTWRYWEEAFIINDEIESTTYFQSLMNVIKLFEREGLIDQLLIAPHNKFSKYISEHMKDYEHIICEDPAEALKVSRVFITDYSSIIYDSTYQGGFPIFYWKDSNYLIDNYKAIPPVNEENAPGIIAKTDEELISAIKYAINNNFERPKEIMKKYRAINEFHDNKNTERVIEYLIKDGIL